jgi:glycosyltransferase involved in cell wall biosynthesis
MPVEDPEPVRIVYPVSEPVDPVRARFAQIVQTAHALAGRGAGVDLLVGRSPDPVTLLGLWGLSSLPALTIRSLPALRRDDGWLRPSWNAIYHWACLATVARRGGARRYDLVYVRHPKLAAFLVRFRSLLGCPLVYEAHELFHLTSPPGRAGPLRALEARLFSRVDAVVAITATLGQCIEEVFHPAAPIFVVPDGVGLDRFRPRAWRGGRRVCYVGQLYPWKGVDLLVRAMAHLPDEEALVVGGGPGDVSRLEDLAVAQGVAPRIRFTGQVPAREAAETLASAGVAVLPGTRTWRSSHFTSPLKLFEYMAAGVPIVAADLPSFREVLRHEENALLYAPDDPRALAGAIARVLDDPGLAARLRAQALAEVPGYSWPARADRLLEAFAAVARRPPRP